jgi:hypothetical protein
LRGSGGNNIGGVIKDFVKLATYELGRKKKTEAIGKQPGGKFGRDARLEDWMRVSFQEA